jgi:anti-sigma-K factor RskA
MSCEELSDVYELYALGLLDGVEKEEAEAHLERGCETCRENLRNAMAANAMLMSLSAEAAPPRRLKHRVMASIGVERSRWSWAAALAAVCMLVVALWLSVEERQRTADLADARHSLLQVQAERDKMLQALSFLNQPETRQVGFGKGEPAPPRGNVFVNPRSGVLMIASNLPRLASGRIFEMWIIPKGGAPRPAGLFQSDTAGAGFHILAGPLDLSTVSAVAVTVEPEAGSATPTMPIIIMAPVAGL